MSKNDIMYVLINQNILYFEQFKSQELGLVLHEYLATLVYLVNVIKLSNGTLDETKVFDNIFVVKVSNAEATTPVWTDKIQFDFKSLSINNHFFTIPIVKRQYDALYDLVINMQTKQIKQTNVIKQTNITKTKQPAKQLPIKQPNKYPTKTPSISSSVSSPVKHAKDEAKDEQVDIAQLEQQILLLEQKKAKEELELAEMAESVKAEESVVVDLCDEHRQEKRELAIKKERLNEKRRVFENDKIVYYRIKKDIVDGKLTESKVSPLFTQKYAIFEIMNEDEQLNGDEAFAKYCHYESKLKENKQDNIDDAFARYFNNEPKCDDLDKQPFVPHNHHYLSKEKEEQSSMSDNEKQIFENENTTFESFL